MRPASLTYAVDETPPLPRLLPLAVQDAVMIAIYLVLVVIILRHANIPDEAGVRVLAMALVAAAIGTALQGLPRGPVGSGFLAPPVYSAIYLAPSILAAEKGGLPLVFGMTIFSGIVVMLIGLVVGRLKIIFTHVLSGLTVFLVGLQLGLVGIAELIDVADENLPTFHLHVAVSVLTLGVAVGLSIWGRGQLKLLCSLIGLVAGFLAAMFAGLIEPEMMTLARAAPWTAMPWPDIGYRFDPALAPAFLAASVAAAIRTVGVVTTCQRINDSEWRRPDMANIRKGVLADGLACTLAGLLGAPGMNIAPSLVGLSSATGATSRVIGFAAAALLLAFALSPKVATLFLMIPSEVAGGVLVFTASFMITSGMETMLSRPLQQRAVYIVGVATLLALSRSLYPDYFSELSPFFESFTSSELTVGLSAAILLHVLFLIGARQTAATTWTREEGSVAEALAFLRKQAEAWKVDARTVEESVEDARHVLERATRDAGAPAGGRLAVALTGADLRLDIVMPETHGFDPPPGRIGRFHQDHLDHEEAAVHAGLVDFHAAAERKRVIHRDGETIVRLWYGV